MLVLNLDGTEVLDIESASVSEVPPGDAVCTFELVTDGRLAVSDIWPVVGPEGMLENNEEVRETTLLDATELVKYSLGTLVSDETGSTVPLISEDRSLADPDRELAGDGILLGPDCVSSDVKPVAEVSIDDGRLVSVARLDPEGESVLAEPESAETTELETPDGKPLVCPVAIELDEDNVLAPGSKGRLEAGDPVAERTAVVDVNCEGKDEVSDPTTEPVIEVTPVLDAREVTKTDCIGAVPVLVAIGKGIPGLVRTAIGPEENPPVEDSPNSEFETV